MNRFSEFSKCPKCGHGGVSTVYRGGDIFSRGRDYISRTCNRCGYNWRQAPNDAPPPAAPKEAPADAEK